MEKLAGTRMAGVMLTRQAPAGNWGVATYALKKVSEVEEHGGHRDHGNEEPHQDGSVPPITSMLAVD
jgi:hypothetical protein